MTGKIKVEDLKKQVKNVDDQSYSKRQKLIQATLFHIRLKKTKVLIQDNFKMWKYAMCQKDKDKHIFAQYVNIYFHLHLSKQNVITIFVKTVWISSSGTKILLLSHAPFVQKLFP